MASSESCSGWMGVIELVPEGNIDAERESSNGSRMVDKGRSKLCRGRLEIRVRVENQPGIVAVEMKGKLLLIVQCVGEYILVVIACSKPKMILSRVVMREQTVLAISFFLLNRGRSVKLIHDFKSEARLGRFEELDTADNAVSPSWSMVFVLGAGVEIWES